MGLPFVLKDTCSNLIRELSKINSDNIYCIGTYFDKLFNSIDDILYKKFIEDFSEFYSEREIKIIAKYNLILSYGLLKMEGELPKVDKTKFEVRLESSTNRKLSIITKNIVSNKDKVYEDNPIYCDFIMHQVNHFPETKNSNKLENIIKLGTNSDRLLILSDILSGYMLLADSVK